MWTGSAQPTVIEHAYNLHGPAAPADQMWMTVSVSGSVSGSVDPGHPGAFRYLADVIVNVAEKYDIDGVHLDYIRYPEGADYGYNPTALERFRRLFNRTGSAAASDPAWSDFRRAQVTQLVRQIYLRATAINPRLKVSAALITWGDGPRNDQEFRAKDAYRLVFQDWRSWLEEGVLDLGIPLNYFREPSNAGFFDRWNEFEKDRQYRRGVLVGPAIYLNSIPDSLRQATRALAPSTAGNKSLGICFYSYASTNTLNSAGAPVTPNAEFYRAIADFFGATDTPPELPWKTRPTAGHVMGRLEASGAGPAWLVDGATVRLINETDQSEAATTTDSSGFFGFVDRAPGLYHLAIERAGQSVFRSIQQTVAAGAVSTFETRLRAEDLAAVLPRFASNGLVNAASLQPGPQSPGALASLFGQNLATRTEAATRVPLPTELAGTQVLILGEAVPLLYVSPTQINFQIPYSLAARTENLFPVVVRHSGTESEPRNLASGTSVAIFQLGAGPAVFHAETFEPVTAANPARAGEYLAIYATGLGLTTPPAQSGAPGAGEEPLNRTVANTMVSLGNRLLTVSYSGLAPGLVGVYQVNVQVPTGLPAGAVRLALLIGSTPSSPVEIPVR